MKTKRVRVKSTYPMHTNSNDKKTLWVVLYADGTTKYVWRPKGKRPR